MPYPHKSLEKMWLIFSFSIRMILLIVSFQHRKNQLWKWPQYQPNSVTQPYSSMRFGWIIPFWCLPIFKCTFNIVEVFTVWFLASDNIDYITTRNSNKFVLFRYFILLVHIKLYFPIGYILCHNILKFKYIDSLNSILSHIYKYSSQLYLTPLSL